MMNKSMSKMNLLLVTILRSIWAIRFLKSQWRIKSITMHGHSVVLLNLFQQLLLMMLKIISRSMEKNHY